MLTYISNSDHYKEVLSRVQSVKHTLWIGTADIKDLYVEVGKESKPFLALIAQLIRKGVEVRLIHAKEPGPNFREDFDKYPVLYDRLERVCIVPMPSSVENGASRFSPLWAATMTFSHCCKHRRRHMSTSRCWSLTARKCMWEARTLQVPASE